ncbi:MAG TPA: serine/threonine-protein kinase, partial [Kofleriaceae bacterium]
ARQGDQAGRFTGMELGEFRLGAVIGRGGMGEVYDAEHASGGLPAAVKVVTRAGAQSQYAMKRFDREIRIAASLVSPHVARVIAHSAPHDPVKYLAMEKLVGTSLADLLRDRKMPVREALEMLGQVAIAVDLAHAAGIIHRDLKPSNLFRHDAGPTPLWKVLDFGVSKLTDGGGTLTADAIIGTPGYMAPEQASGAEVGRRADIFAMGAIAYRVLVGRPAFGGRDLGAALYAVVHGMPPRPSVAAAVPHDVDHALAVALAKSPGERYASASELVDALTDACRASLSLELRHRGATVIEKHPWQPAR